jgi:hypothetical protein
VKTVEGASGRRGRAGRGPAGRTGPAGEFARRLWQLKQAAGDPSYDRMRDQLGALASKSALSAAARGDRLPSWDTAWEFARVLAVGVLGQDEDRARRYWRSAWEAAAHPEPAPAETAPEPEPPAGQPVPEPSGPGNRAGFRYGPALAGAAAATIAALAGFGLGRRSR